MDRSLRANLVSPWATAACVALISLVAVSDKSFWIDEALTAVKAMQPDFSSWWQAMLQERTSDLQMPFYMAYMWAFEKLFGHGEWTLRLANLPWFVAGATAFIHAFPNDRRPIALFLTAFSPFAWYYLDEARPYAMVLGAALLAAASLMGLRESACSTDRPARFRLKPLLFSVVLLSGTTMLAMIWAAAALGLVPVFLSRQQLKEALRRELRSIILAGLGLLALACYYFFTLRAGARGGAASPTNIGSLLFLGYEIFGFSGLGPGRLQMRSEGLASLRPYAGWLVLYALALVGLLYAAYRQRKASLWLAGLVCLLPAAFIVAVGLLAHWRVLGRHMAPLVPVLWLVLVVGFASLQFQRRPLSRSILLLFCLLTLFSCLATRFARRHAKDDYRTAAALAKTALARGQRVWWNAAEEGARYYGVPVTHDPTATNQVLILMNPTQHRLQQCPAPDVIVASKPDVYDGGVVVTAYLRDRNYQLQTALPAFTVWQAGRP